MTSVRRRRLLALLLLLAVVAGVAGIGIVASYRTPTPPIAGTQLHGPARLPAPESPVFRVAQYNMAGGKGTDRRLDLGRTASVVHLHGTTHFVGLNEIRGGDLLGSRDQAEILGDLTGLGWLFAPAQRRWFSDNIGNGILTSMDVASWQAIPVEVQRPTAPRQFILARVRHDGHTINVLVVHLGRGDDQPEHTRLTRELFLSLAEPAILLGDLNVGTGEPEMAELVNAPGVVNASSHPQMDPSIQLDWILLRGLEVVGSGIVPIDPHRPVNPGEPTDYSDHPFVWADVRVKAPAD